MAEGVIHLVGAGPGDPGLLTLAGWERLQEADCVVHDSLVDPRLLDFAAPQAERIDVGKRSGRAEHCVSQEWINQLLIDKARAGKRVVRLKGGDPLLFARGGEEALALQAAGVHYEIVPGVSAALASAASASIPLTSRHLASAVALVTGHEDPEKEAGLDWSALARFPGTLVVYMARKRIGAIAQTLLAQGRPAQTPIALIEWGGSNRQRVLCSTLGQVSAKGPLELSSPVLAIIGEVCTLREQLGWFERRVLFGQRILLLQPGRQAPRTARQLERLGAHVLCQPAIEIEPPSNWDEVDRTLDRLESFDWLVFTSRHGVESFLGRLRERGQDLRRLGSNRLAAVGPGTAAALATFHLNPDVVPSEFRAEGLVAALADKVVGKRVLLVRANRGRDVLPVELARCGAEVTTVVAYRQKDVLVPSPHVQEALRSGDLDWVFLSSSSMALAFFGWLDPELAEHVRQRIGIVSISPVTSETIRAAGYPVAVEAKVYTLPGVIDALVETIQARGARHRET